MATNNAVNTTLSGQTGTGTFAGSTSPTFVTPILGAASATSISFSSTSGIIGTTTNNNAAAGSVGEIISSVIPNATPVSFTAATPGNLTSISLTAGDWDLYGNITFTATTVTSASIWISQTSASLPDSSLYNIVIGLNTGNTLGFSAPYFRASISGTTTFYLSGSAGATGTLTGRGGFFARRAR